MAVISIPGYTTRTGPGGIPIYTPKRPVAPPLKYQPPGIKYTGTVGTGGIPIYTPNRVAIDGGGAGATGGGQPAVQTPAPTPGRWQIPDYGSMIPGDWEVLGAEAEGNKRTGEAEAAFQRQLRQAFIDFGGDSAKIGDYSKYIDAPTLEAARSNKFSQIAQSLAAMTRGLRNQRAHNASAGMSTSGRSVGQTRRALEAKEFADYGAQRTFMGGAEQGVQGLASVRQQIADMIANARSSAANRLQQSYPGEWIPGDTPEVADIPTAAAPPAAAAPWGGISWGGRSGITTVAQMKAALGPGVSYATWASKHPAAAARLR